MRDLKKDKAMCNAEITETPGAYTIDVEELEKGFYMWRERAIKAEAKLDRLIEGCMRCAGEDDHERFQRLRAENAKLQLALKKACDMLPACPDELGRLDDMFLRAAERDLRELEG